MRRPRKSPGEIRKLSGQIEKIQLLDKRRRRLYNRKFRRSFLFIATWVVRLIYISLFFIVLVFNDTSTSFKDEIVVNKTVESYTSSSRRGSQKITTLYLETNFDKYTSNIGDEIIPDFGKGDTIVIERNLFGKPIYFFKETWGYKYGIDVNLQLYYIILFVTVISLFFNDGLDRFTNKILWIAWTIDIIGIACYFLT